MSPFVHFHTHSNYSFLTGASSIESLCEAARARGFTHLALTDTNGFYGLQKFLQISPAHHLQPIVGVFIQTKKNEAVCIAKSENGYRFLCNLVTRRHMDKHFSLIDGLKDGAPAVAVISKDRELLGAIKDRVECRVEIRPGKEGFEALKYAKENALSPLATNAVYFAHPEDFKIHKLLRAIHLNCTLSDLTPRDIATPSQWLKSERELSASFPHIPEALDNAWKLARDCKTHWRNHSQIFPAYQNKKEDHFELLQKRCLGRVRWRYGKMSQAIQKRLDYELSIIREKEFVDYFLVVADIVNRFPIHCGRGSSAASLVSYLLGITHVDPMEHKLSFYRFLSPNRRDLPDIDVDFPWDERDKVIEFVKENHGSKRMAMVANHVGFKARGAIREVAKVFGLTSAEIKEVTGKLSFYSRANNLPQQISTHPRFRGFHFPHPWPEILSLAARLSGFPRYLSVHCGGTVLVPDQITDYVPVQKAPKGVNIIQWEKDQAESAGLVKIDLLGNRSLSVIRDALNAIRRNYGYTIDYGHLNPLHDRRTQKLLERGDTMGIFYVESPAMRRLQKMTGKGDFEHLVIHSSIIRPAANRYIMEYVRRLHGKPYRPLHPLLKDELKETYGIMCYQEDVSGIAMKLAGFDPGTAEELRKTLTKKSKKKLPFFREKFFSGCRTRGIPERIITEIWKMIESFGGYSFCKPHSASYALVSFKSAYLKAHFPAEFMAAAISNQGGYYSTFAYLSEAKRMGLRIIGPDINESEWHYTGKKKTIRIGLQQLQQIRKSTIDTILAEREKRPFDSLDDLLRRVPLKDNDFSILVRSGTLDSISGGLTRPQMFWQYSLWRKFKGSSSWFHFYRENTTPLTIKHCNAYFHARGLRLLEPPARRGGYRAFAPAMLVYAENQIPGVNDYSRERKWQDELETLGGFYSIHPLFFFRDAVRKSGRNIVSAKSLAKHVGKTVSVLGCLITRKEILSKNREAMEFVSFEDETAIYETVLFPDIYARFCQHLDMKTAFILTGKVASDFGALILEIKHIEGWRMRQKRVPELQAR